VSVAAGDSAQTIASKVNASVPNLTATASNTINIDNVTGMQVGDTYTLEVNGQSITTGDIGGTATTAATAIGAAIQASSALAGLTVADAANGTLTISNSTGADISVKITGGSGGGTFDVNGTLESGAVGTSITLTENTTTGSVLTGTVAYTTGLPATTTIGLNSSGAITNASTSVLAATATTISTVDIGTYTGAQSAIAVIDAALATVSGDRADLGALQNRFGSIASNLATNSENQTAARSRIMDADFAVETASLTRGQILQQAGIAVLAHANAAPQNVLALLQ